MVTPKSAPQYFSVSWDTFHRDCRALVWRLLNVEQSRQNSWEGIIAITRGGLVPAAIVARELNIRVIDTVCIRSYSDDKSLGEMEILKQPITQGTGKNWLIIDDLVDTGGTAKVIRKMLPDAHFATVYAKPAGLPLVDTSITEVSQETWILFPWDTELTDSTPLIERRSGGL